MASDGKIPSKTLISIDRAVDVWEIVDISANSTNKTTVNNALGITGNPLGDTDSQTISNKTLTNPTINAATLSGTLAGTYTIGGTPTFPATVVLTSGNQTVNGTKTITGLVANAPTLTNASITADAYNGFTNANNGAVFGLTVTASQLGTTALATNAVQSSQLATNAITLGYAQVTSNFSTASTTAVQITGLTVTVTIPAGSRRIKITAFARDFYTATAGANVTMSIWDGTVGSGTQLAATTAIPSGGGVPLPALALAIVTPAAGSKTYNIGLQTANGADVANIEAAATYPAFILVEVI